MPYPTELFPLFWDGNQDFVERYAFRTTVFTSRSGLEQRRRRRIHPVGAFQYSFLGLPSHRAQVAQQLLANLQGNEWWVPWWPYSERLSAQLDAGATTVPYAYEAVPIRTMTGIYHPIAFWADADHWEIATVTGGGSGPGGLLALANPTVNTWPIGTRVVPLRRGWIVGDQEVSWPTFDLVSGSLSWQLAEAKMQNDGWLTPDPEIETFERRPSRGAENPIQETLSRLVTAYDPGLGERVAYLETPAATRTRTYRWILKTRTEVADMRDFLDRRWGMAIPFRMPSWQRDMTLAEDIAADTGEFNIRAFGYSDHLYPAGPMYRQLYFRSPDGASTAVRNVVGCLDNEDGTEDIELDSATGFDMTPDTQVMFLRYCRLGDDAAEFHWKTGHVATIDLPVREILEPAVVIL